MPSTPNDALMYFIAEGATQPIPAESTSQLTPGDKLTSDFKANSYCNIDSFSVGLELKDSEGADKEEKPAAVKAGEGRGTGGTRPTVAAGSTNPFIRDEQARGGRDERAKERAKSGEDNKRSGSYERWRSINQDGVKPTPPYKAEPEDLVITRAIDSASPILMQLCLTQKMLQSAVLVRCGHSGAGTSLGFFRMEFSDVRIKSMDWSDGELIKETCRLKFAKVKITYVKRNVDGSSAASMNCQWDGTSNG